MSETEHSRGAPAGTTGGPELAPSLQIINDFDELRLLWLTGLCHGRILSNPPPFEFPMSPRRYLRCLGQPALFAPTGEPIRFRTRKHLALLVYLAIEGNQPQRRTPRRLSAPIATTVSNEPIDVPAKLPQQEERRRIPCRSQRLGRRTIERALGAKASPTGV